MTEEYSFKQYFDDRWYRLSVGGMWKKIGELQFTFIVNQGLQQHHKLLDVGCGALRGGRHFINYLDKGNYYGIDADDDLVDCAHRELEEHKLTDKNPTIVRRSNFGFTVFDTEFDYAIAISVFTHIPLNDIIKCLIRMEKALKSGGVFYATFFEANSKRDIYPIAQVDEDSVVITNQGKDPYHYPLDVFRWICEDTELEVEYIGEWGHPRAQKMLKFTKI